MADAKVAMAAGGPRLSLHPVLAAELEAPLSALRLSGGDATWKSHCKHLRKLREYVNSDSYWGPSPSSCADFDGLTGGRFQSWLVNVKRLSVGSAKRAISFNARLLDKARNARGLGPLAWPRQQGGKKEATQPEVDLDESVQVIRRLAEHHASCGENLREGAALRAIGIDPTKQAPAAAWHPRANVAVGAGIFVDASLTDPEVRWGNRHFQFIVPAGCGLPVHRPTALDGLATKMDVVRWFVPVLEDMAHSQLLAIALLGFNRATALNIDVTSELSWARLRGLEPVTGDELVEIRALKVRSGSVQHAVCPRSGPFSAYQVIAEAASRCEPLRAEVRRRLEARLAAPDPDRRVQEHAVGRLREMLRSPWLYYNEHRVSPLSGRVCCGGSTTSVQECLDRARIAVSLHGGKEARADLPGVAGPGRRRRRPLVISDLRDALALFALDWADGDVHAVVRALSSGSVDAIRPYVWRADINDRHLERFAAGMDVVFEEVERFGRIDPAVLFLRARGVEVTDGLRRRLNGTDGSFIAPEAAP